MTKDKFQKEITSMEVFPRQSYWEIVVSTNLVLTTKERYKLETYQKRGIHFPLIWLVNFSILIKKSSKKDQEGKKTFSQ